MNNKYHKFFVRAHLNIMHESLNRIITNHSISSSNSIHTIEMSFHSVFTSIDPKALNKHFRAQRYFEQSELNTRDAGEELCVLNIYLAAQAAKVHPIGSFKFYRRLEVLANIYLGERVTSIFPSALKKNKLESKKSSLKTFKRFIDRRTCRSRYNSFVKSELLFQDMKAKNIGSKTSKAALMRQKNKEVQYSEYSGQRSIRKCEEQREYRDNYLKSIRTSNGKSAHELQRSAFQHFTELYIELIALEKIAKDQDFSWLFITLTCPPEFHPNPAKGKLCWQNYDARSANDYLNSRWRNLGKSFNTAKGKGLKFDLGTGFGKRVVEPHKDGCPHWHIMLFCKRDLTERYKELFRYFFERRGVHGCNIKEKGIDIYGNTLEIECSAASYLTKYISKSLSVDIDGGNVKQTDNVAIEAWRHATKIRSHSQFGYTGVKTKYRDCRKFAAQNMDCFRIINEEDDIKSNAVEARRFENTIDELAGDCPLKRFTTRVLLEAKLKRDYPKIFMTIQEQNKKLKAIRSARKTLFIRTMKHEFIQAKTNCTSGSEYTYKLLQADKLAQELFNIIKVASAKTMTDENGNKCTDFQAFMKIAEKLSYIQKDAFNRFGEEVKYNESLTTKDSSITIQRYGWVTHSQAIHLQKKDLLKHII
ncbi:replication endonuclease [Vibrio splendidus]